MKKIVLLALLMVWFANVPSIAKIDRGKPEIRNITLKDSSKDYSAIDLENVDISKMPLYDFSKNSCVNQRFYNLISLCDQLVEINSDSDSSFSVEKLKQAIQSLFLGGERTKSDLLEDMEICSCCLEGFQERFRQLEDFPEKFRQVNPLAFEIAIRTNEFLDLVRMYIDQESEHLKDQFMLCIPPIPFPCD